MQKIASPSQLQDELRALVAASTHGVSRLDMADRLLKLADRVLAKKDMSTTELYKATVKALEDKKWGPARALLDDLGLRRDNKKKLKDAEEYGMPKSNPYYDILQDRIEQVNAYV